MCVCTSIMPGMRVTSPRSCVTDPARGLTETISPPVTSTTAFRKSWPLTPSKTLAARMVKDDGDCGGAAGVDCAGVRASLVATNRQEISSSLIRSPPERVSIALALIESSLNEEACTSRGNRDRRTDHPQAIEHLGVGRLCRRAHQQEQAHRRVQRREDLLGGSRPP